MRAATMILIVFQIMVVCFITFGSGYSKCKLPKTLLLSNALMLIINFTLIITNMNRL